MNDSSPLVSVIIPAYNAGDFVEACLCSVIGQTYHNLEIIVVNDGSTDDTPRIVEKYASVDSRIFLVSKENEGLPLARRTGIDVAKGKYIQHLDSDDTLLEDAIENLVEKAEGTDADIVAAPFFFCYTDQPARHSGELAFTELSGIAYLDEILHLRAYWSVWSNFQKRSLFLEHDIEIVPHIYYGEDAILMTQLLTYASKVVSLDKPILHYNRFSSSMTYGINDEKYRNFRLYPAWIEDFLNRKGLAESLGEKIALLHIRTTFSSLSWGRFEDTRTDMKRIIDDLKQYPALEKVLARRERKIISVYRISSWLGHINLLRYKRQGKI